MLDYRSNKDENGEEQNSIEHFLGLDLQKNLYPAFLVKLQEMAPLTKPDQKNLELPYSDKWMGTAMQLSKAKRPEKGKKLILDDSSK